MWRMTALAERQADLLRALLAGAAVPAGFDARQVAAQADALVAKRGRVIAMLRPELSAATGDRFGALFAEYAAGHPRATGTRARTDAETFASWLAARGEFPEKARSRRRWGWRRG
jgi:hypothetical protein